MDESAETSKRELDPKPSIGFQFSWGPVLAIGGVLLLMSARALCYDLHEGRILREGTPARAQVLAIKPTGNSVNDDQEMRLDLDVRPEGRESYRAKVEAYLHPVHFPRYQPGAVVDVRFDPKKPGDVALVPP